VSISAVTQDVWPPRVLVTVGGLTVSDTVEVYRTVGGVDTLLRGGAGTATDIAWLVVDAELPFGVPVSYTAIVNGGAPQVFGPTTYDLPGGNVALTDAITGAAAEVRIGRWPEKTYARRSSQFAVGGRTVVVSGELGQPVGEIEFYVETTSSRDQVMTLLASATESVVQIRQPGGYDGVDSYQAVLGVRERRFSQDGSDPRRLIIVQAAETESWPLILEAQAYTYQDLEDVYTGLTYAQLEADYATYLDLAQAELSP
jgi:hypothetical protein